MEDRLLRLVLAAVLSRADLTDIAHMDAWLLRRLQPSDPASDAFLNKQANRENDLLHEARRIVSDPRLLIL